MSRSGGYIVLIGLEGDQRSNRVVTSEMECYQLGTVA